MHRFWNSLLRPILDEVQPDSIVEIGIRAGILTRDLLGWCRDNDGFCHLIDPEPPWNLDEIGTLLETHGEWHRATSLEVLSELSADLYLLDGDHNWYTVHRELTAIEESIDRAGRPFPVICLHDVAWPYGRRDLYYAPERIPAEHRHPHARRGIELGRSSLLERGGFNHLHWNAEHEGGPRNGVFTAVEDFLSESDRELRCARIRAFHGLGVIWSPSALGGRRSARLAELVELPPHVARLVEDLEAARLEVTQELRETARRLGGRPGSWIAACSRLANRIRSVLPSADRAAAPEKRSPTS